MHSTLQELIDQLNLEKLGDLEYRGEVRIWVMQGFRWPGYCAGSFRRPTDSYGSPHSFLALLLFEARRSPGIDPLCRGVYS